MPKPKSKPKKKVKKTKKKTPTLSGLTSTTGLMGGGIHINAPYIVEDDKTVFVGDYDEMSWERMSVSEAKKKKLSPIKCSYCAKPAVRLDHMWPYVSGTTSCHDHLDRYDAD